MKESKRKGRKVKVKKKFLDGGQGEEKIKGERVGFEGGSERADGACLCRAPSNAKKAKSWPKSQGQAGQRSLLTGLFRRVSGLLAPAAQIVIAGSAAKRGQPASERAADLVRGAVIFHAWPLTRPPPAIHERIGALQGPVFYLL